MTVTDAIDIQIALELVKETELIKEPYSIIIYFYAVIYYDYCLNCFSCCCYCCCCSSYCEALVKSK